MVPHLRRLPARRARPQGRVVTRREKMRRRRGGSDERRGVRLPARRGARRAAHLRRRHPRPHPSPSPTQRRAGGRRTAHGGAAVGPRRGRKRLRDVAGRPPVRVGVAPVRPDVQARTRRQPRVALGEPRRAGAQGALVEHQPTGSDGAPRGAWRRSASKAATAAREDACACSAARGPRRRRRRGRRPRGAATRPPRRPPRRAGRRGGPPRTPRSVGRGAG